MKCRKTGAKIKKADEFSVKQQYLKEIDCVTDVTTRYIPDEYGFGFHTNVTARYGGWGYFFAFLFFCEQSL